MIGLENISVGYNEQDPVLHNINLHIKPGSFHFITGQSGAGKTTLLKLIFLALRPLSGQLHMFGRNIGKLKHHELPYLRRRIGVVFQDFRLLDHLNIYENVSLPLRIDRQREKNYRGNVIELLEWVGLGKKLDHTPLTLSGGEKQLVAIARAVVTRPDLIIADEPTGNVDPEKGQKLLKLLESLNNRKTTILIATHDQYIWQNFPHNRLHLENGQLIHLPHKPQAQ